MYNVLQDQVVKYCKYINKLKRLNCYLTVSVNCNSVLIIWNFTFNDIIYGVSLAALHNYIYDLSQ